MLRRNCIVSASLVRFVHSTRRMNATSAAAAEPTQDTPAEIAAAMDLGPLPPLEEVTAPPTPLAAATEPPATPTPAPTVPTEQDEAPAAPEVVPQSLTSLASRTQALETKSTRELVRTMTILQACSIGPIVRAAPTLIDMSAKILGKYITFDIVIGKTFFRQFCAGTNSKTIVPRLKRLTEARIGCVLDYAVEADAAPATGAVDAGPQRMEQVLLSKPVYSPEDLRGEAMDQKLQFVTESITDASYYRNGTGLAYTAVKVTALAPTELLRRVSSLQLELRRVWHELAGNPARELEECSGAAGVMDTAPANAITSRLSGAAKVDFMTALGLSPESADANLTVRFMDFVEAVTDLQTNKDPAVAAPVLDALGVRGCYSQEERAMIDQVRARMLVLAVAAVAENVTLLIDAEQSYFQPAIDLFTREAQRTHNTERAVLMGTYQCYIKQMETRLANDMARSQHQGWVWGGKLVRGAYMVQERALAETYGYASPIHGTKFETDACYDRCALSILVHMTACPNVPISVLFGTHNAQSVQIITDVMAAQHATGGVAGIVCFGQLLGMADTLTIPLATNGYNVFKYVPYGPVDEVVPYLVRRAQENASILQTPDGVVERQLIRKELLRRGIARKVLVVWWSTAALVAYVLFRFITRLTGYRPGLVPVSDPLW